MNSRPSGKGNLSRCRVLFKADQISEFCLRWKVREMALFGSAIREDFMPSSDVDVLVSFSPEAPWSLFDFISMQDELQMIFNRPVDILEREALRNPFRRRHILENMEVIYASGGA